ncbi:hypothetical protein Tco_0327710 [Tanacetum coccineum]
MASSLPLIQELARAPGSDVMKDQLVVLFEREVAESVGKIEEFGRLCIELRANIRLRNDYNYSQHRDIAYDAWTVNDVVANGVGGSVARVMTNGVSGSVSEVMVNGVSRSVTQVQANGVMANDVSGSAAQVMTNGVSGSVPEIGVNGLSRSVHRFRQTVAWLMVLVDLLLRP